MSDQKGTPLATDIAVESVTRVHGEQLIALVLSLPTGKTIGMALSEQEASILVVKLLDALRTDDKAPKAERTLHLDRASGAAAALPVEAFQANRNGAGAVLSIQTADKLQIPFSFPSATLEPLGKAFLGLAQAPENDAS
jgi:hypothetical protein